jgi:hypothetical protein
MSNYDVEMVKKFAELNKELIEKTTKQNPEIGGLIKQIINSIIEEEKPANPIFLTSVEEDNKMWLSIPLADELASSHLTRTITYQLESVGRFMGSNKSSNLTIQEFIDLVVSTSLMGKFSQLSDDPKQRETYRNVYGELEDYETIVKFSIDPKLHNILGESIMIPTGKDYVFDGKFLEQFVAFFPKRGALTDEELQELSDVLSNKAIYNFLENLGKNGFWYSEEASWFKPNIVTKEEVVLDDEYGKTLRFDPDFLKVELGINLVPAPKPKFSMGDKVMVTALGTYKGETGTIIKRTWSEAVKTYSYEVELSSKADSFYEDQLEKYTKPTTKKAKTIKPKQTVNSNPTPAEIEISNMTQDQLQTLKSEIEETLTYLEEGDVEKNDLEIQLELVNLYLEN